MNPLFVEAIGRHPIFNNPGMHSHRREECSYEENTVLFEASGSSGDEDGARKAQGLLALQVGIQIVVKQRSVSGI